MAHNTRPTYSIGFFGQRGIDGKLRVNSNYFVVTEHRQTKHCVYGYEFELEERDEFCRVGKWDLLNQLLKRGIPLDDAKALTLKVEQLGTTT